MDFIYSDQKAEVQWEARISNSIKTKKEQSLKALLIRGNSLFVIGLLGRLMKQVAKMTQSLSSGINKGILDPL